ncbi:MAG: penicillin-binding transpeptidase domain-containing protein [Patescibacteria group bacterium]
MKFRSKKKRIVELDEILLDVSNLPSFNTGRMEGRRELPIKPVNVYLIGVCFIIVAIAFFGKIFHLQVTEGARFRTISDNNSVNTSVIIAERGVVFDRKGEPLIWNEHDFTDQYDFPVRAYTDRLGMGQLIGYVSYPQRDKKGVYYRTEYLGRTGVESAFEDDLHGTNGEKIIEQDALGEIIGEHALSAPVEGKAITLSVDAGLSEAMYQIIATSSAQAGFRSGAGAIMDIHTGEILAMTSYPSYDPEVMADGDNTTLISEYNKDDRLPFLNKVVSGVYTPGSIVKPFVAYAALSEKIIDPNKTIVSNGYLVVPNPYNPSNPSRFNDWRAHGAMTMREAIAFSSNVYFYIIGGGFGDQAGLGITKMSQYYKLFGMGSTTGITIASEQEGVVPTPAWKKETFDDDWRLGDTYFTAIGQYGFQATPLQMLRAYGALASGGTLVTPHVIKGEVSSTTDIGLNREYLKVVHEGMRKTVIIAGGTARGLERKDVAIAAKSGTAEIGAGNAFVNSWAAGFWPYEDPKFAFILLMDKAPRSNALGATRIMGGVFDWMALNRPEYINPDKAIEIPDNTSE